MTSRALCAFRFGAAMVVATTATSVGLALTFDVNTTADGPDANPGDGVCATLVGPCTLQAAFEEANALGGAHTVNLPYGTYSGGHNISADVTLVGFRGGPVNGRPRITHGSPALRILGGAQVSITDVAVLYGESNCIYNAGNLVLTGVGVYSCTGAIGAGVINEGVLTMTDGNIEDCECLDYGGVFDGMGGGLFNGPGATATVTEVAFARNTAAKFGGGVTSYGSELTLIDCWLDENDALYSGGGVLAVLGALTLTRVTLSRNFVTDDSTSKGGGVFAQNTTSTLTNVTFHSNTSVGPGGALYLLGGNVGLVNVTIVGNSSGLGTAVGTTVQVVNTLFHESSAACILDEPLVSFGHNLDSGDTCGLDGPGDLVNAAVETSAPGLYGGFGQTVPLIVGSPGIDDGDSGLAPPTDQRGVPRFDGDGDGLITADIGAYEYDILFGDDFETGTTSAWAGTNP